MIWKSRENDCVGCERCVNCGRNKYYYIVDVYCESCGRQYDKMYEYDGSQYCDECLLEQLEKDEVIKVMEGSYIKE